MGTFITGNSALPTDKANLNALPGGANPINYVQSTDYNALTSALYDVRNHVKGWVSVLEYGAVGDGSTDDTTAIQAAINTGKNVFIPGAVYRTTAPLVISTAGQKVYGQGPGVSTLSVNTAQITGIDIQADDVVVANLRVAFTMAKTFFSGAGWRGGQQYLQNTAFYTNKHRTRFYNCEAHQAINGIWLSNSLNNGAYSGYRDDWVVDGFRASECEFGILMDGANRARINNVYVIHNWWNGDASTGRSHAVYTGDNLGNTNCWFGPMYAIDCTDGFAFSLKGCDRCIFDSLYAKNCGGIITMTTGDYTVFDNVVAEDDLGYLTTGSIYMQAMAQHTQFNNVFIRAAASSQRVANIYGNYTYFNKLYVIVQRASGGIDLIFTDATNAYVNDLTIINQGAGGAGAYVGTPTIRHSRLV